MNQQPSEQVRAKLDKAYGRTKPTRRRREVDPAQLDAIVRENVDLVRRLARRYARVTGPTIDVEDLISVGVIGLIEAHSLYDPAGGRTFRVYAEFRVRGAILDELRRLDPMSQPQRRKAKQFGKAKEALAAQLGRDPSEPELAKSLGLSLPELQKMRREAEHRSVPLDKTNPVELVSGLSRSSMKSTQLRMLLSGAVEQLPERDQQILSMYYVQDMTMKEIGKVFDLTEARVSQLHKAAAKKLRTILEKDGAVD